MKIIKLTISIVLLSFLASHCNAQVINWASLQPKQKNIFNINTGFDRGFVLGVGYGYQLKIKFPVVAQISYSFPSGKKLTDDFKTKVAATVQLYKIKNFRFSADIEGIFRRYENSSARLLNFGSEMNAIIGYYKKSWFVAGEFGFDKAITTHFKHSDEYKSYYPGAKNGWYIPTGGNFIYGLQGGYSFKNYDITLKSGRTVEQDFKTTDMVPYYFLLGFSYKL